MLEVKGIKSAGTPDAERAAISSSQRFTFRGNVTPTRHGWLRLTPAYSVHLVRELLADFARTGGAVLDPFCGTGTTLLACAENGLDGATVDLNPFLVWLASAKTAAYASADLDGAERLVRAMADAARANSGPVVVPAIHRIERWWSSSVVGALGRAAARLRAESRDAGAKSRDLAALALCRTLIAVANVSFGHQSMSFKKVDEGRAAVGPARVARTLLEALAAVSDTASPALPPGKRRVLLGDSRDVRSALGEQRFSLVLTSPPYANRMSYIRELRPYMYWLGYLGAKEDAGELDWRAIGGTWGAATSRLNSWCPDPAVRVPFDGFERIVGKIAERQPLLASYVHRYFEDMVRHVESVADVVSPGGRLRYVLGNSKFYDVMLPTEAIFAAIFEHCGFENGRVTVLRKRTSKKELFEYLVEADKPSSSRASTGAAPRRSAQRDAPNAPAPKTSRKGARRSA